MPEPAWDRVWDVFHRALAAPGEERGEIVERLCGGEAELRREVEDLLAAHDRPDDVLATAAIPATAEVGPDTLVGERVGPYRVRELIDEGGMGTVYTAEQEKPVRRRVALKVIKLGMDTREVLARFEAERQALALMSHPNIASAYDAGATAAGRPYFAMEYVEGVPIDVYCDRQRLDLRARLELLRRVCEGVQHAHQKGVIHRDLKPSNVLVTRLDGRAVPKVIDFGIAKAVGHRLTDRSLATEAGRLLGTPEYMSPEQAGTSDLDVDTRTDVYSLGILLYKLLVGVLPFAARRRDGSGPEEILRRIREEEPPRPSTRWSRLAAEKAQQLADERRTRPGDLARELRRDLDWVVGKALAKEPARRYASASELSADVERYLAQQPVLAGPPSAGYRLRKLAQRYRYRVMAAGVAMLLLTGLGIGLALQTWRLAAALTVAEGERERAEQVTRLLVDVFKVADPSESRGATLTAKEVLDRGAQRIAGELGQQSDTRLVLLSTIGEVYGNLGLHRRSASMLEQVVEQQRQSGDGLELARSLHDLGAASSRAGDFEAAERHLDEALALRRGQLGEVSVEVAATLHEQGTLQLRQGRFDIAEDLLRRALDLRRELLGGEHLGTVDSLQNLGSLEFYRGDFEAAEPFFRQALEVRRRRQGEEHYDVAAVKNNLALALDHKGSPEEAEPLYRESLETWRRLLPADHPRLATGLNNLASFLFRHGDVDSAVELQTEAVDLLRRSLSEDHPSVLTLRHNIGEMLFRRGDAGVAGPILRDVLARRRRALPADHAFLAETLAVLGELETAIGRPERAEPLLREALAIHRRTLPSEHPRIASAAAAHGDCLRVLGRRAEAEALVR